MSPIENENPPIANDLKRPPQVSTSTERPVPRAASPKFPARSKSEPNVSPHRVRREHSRTLKREKSSISKSRSDIYPSDESTSTPEITPRAPLGIEFLGEETLAISMDSIGMLAPVSVHEDSVGHRKKRHRRFAARRSTTSDNNQIISSTASSPALHRIEKGSTCLVANSGPSATDSSPGSPSRLKRSITVAIPKIDNIDFSSFGEGIKKLRNADRPWQSAPTSPTRLISPRPTLVPIMSTSTSSRRLRKDSEETAFYPEYYLTTEPERVQ